MLPTLHRAPSMLSTPPSAFPYGMLPNNNIGQPFHTGAFADHSEEEIVWGRSDKRRAPPLSYSSFSDANLTGSSSGGGGDFVVLSYPPSPRMLAQGPSLLTPVRNQMGSVKGPQLYTPITAASHGLLSVRMAAMSLSANGGAANKAAKKKKAKKERAAGAQKAKIESPSKRQGQTGKAKGKAVVDNSAAPVQAYPSPAPSPATANTKKSRSEPKSPSSGKTKRIGERPAATGLGSRPIVDDISDRLSVISQDNESAETPTLYDEASTFISR